MPLPPLVLGGAPRAPLGPPDRAVAALVLPEAEQRRDPRTRPLAVGVLEAGDAVDLEVERPRPVGVHHLPRPPPVDLDDVAVALEEVDHRRREKRQILRPDLRERRRAPPEQEDDLDLLGGARDHRLQPIDADEVETLGHHEVFAQQPVALEAGPRPRHQRLVVAQADHRRPGDRLQPLALARRPGADGSGRPEQRVEERRRQRPVAEVQIQPVERQLAERPAAGPPQRDPQRRLPGLAADPSDPGRGEGAPVLQIGDGGNLQRPERDVLRRGVGRPGR